MARSLARSILTIILISFSLATFMVTIETHVLKFSNKYIYDQNQPLSVNKSSQNSPWSAATVLQPDTSQITLRLGKYLFGRYYNKMDMPGIKNDPVQMKMNMIFSTVNVNSDQSLMTFGTQIEAEWTDKRLFWLPAEFNGTKSVLVEIDELWHPEFTAINSVDLNSVTVYENSFLYLNSIGNVFWTQPMQFKINRIPDSEFWPLFTYSGILEVGALIKNECAFKLIDTKPFIHMSSSDSEWKVERVSCKKKLQQKESFDREKCDPKTFIIKCYINISRKSNHEFLFVFKYPFALVVAALNLRVFLMLSSGNGKLKTSLLAAFFVVIILMFIYGQIPLTSSPLIVKYYIGSMTLIILTIMIILVDKYFFTISKSDIPSLVIVKFTEYIGKDVMDKDIPKGKWSISKLKVNGKRIFIGIMYKIWFIQFTLMYMILFLYYVF